jgi:ankyrin repeat protein
MQSIRVRTIGTDLLFYHLKYQQIEEATIMLQRREVNVNDQDVNGKTALHIACEIASVPLVKLLLNYGANPNVPTHLDIGYYLPIHKACEKGNREIVEILIRAGTDLNARNKVGQTPLHICVRQKNTELARVVIMAGCDLDVRDTAGCNASYYAKANGLKEVADMLPPPVSMKAEEALDYHMFVRAVLGFDPTAGKKGKKGGKGKKGKKK